MAIIPYFTAFWPFCEKENPKLGYQSWLHISPVEPRQSRQSHQSRAII